MLYAKYYRTEAGNPKPQEVLGTLDSNKVIDGRLNVQNAIEVARNHAKKTNDTFHKGIKSFIIFRDKKITDERNALTGHVNVYV